MTLKFNDYALISGYPRGGVNPPWRHMWAWSSGFVDICCQLFSPGWGIGLLLQNPGGNDPKDLFNAPSRIGWKENNERSVENVVLSHSLIYKESSTSSHAVDKCRLRPDFELFLRQTKLWFVWILIELVSWANCKINFRGPSKVSLY